MEIWQSIFIQKIDHMNDKILSKAAHNLLIECARLKQSDTLLIVREKESLGWYKNDISDFILKYAQERGIHASLDEVGSPEINQDQNFYKKIQPGGPGWKKIVEESENSGVIISGKKEKWDVPSGILCMVFGSISVYSVLFGVGYILYSKTTLGLVFVIISAISVLLLMKFWKRLSTEEN